MEKPVVGLYHSPWAAAQPAKGRSPVSLYRYAVWFKANPRSRDYMRALFEARYPGGTFVDCDAVASWPEAVKTAGTVLLLYPDAIGIGWARIERTIRRLVPPQTALRVLNGRRRDFALDSASRRALALRRALEQSMLLEGLFTAVFLCWTPLLLAADWLRGRR